MPKDEPNMEKKKTYYGAIVIFYTKKNGETKYLVVKNAKSGNISFIAGAQEEADANLEATAKREAGEELSGLPEDLQLVPTSAKQEFVFGPNKPDRVGCKGSYQVFLVDATEFAEQVQPTSELTEIKWLSKDEAIQELTFDDVREVFEQATSEIEP